MPKFPKIAVIVVLGLPPTARAHGPSPENGATLFPGGALFAYNSIFMSRSAARDGLPLQEGMRPTFEHERLFTFSWGIRRDLQFTAQLPVATRRLDLPPRAEEGGTGIGDLELQLKYRFLRRDSDRGTTQASLSIGPKLPTGRTNVRDSVGTILPAALQPGSGSTDLALGAYWTYTGLFHVKRLVADASVQHLRRTEGTQDVRLGDTTDANFWISYRPYQTQAIGREWFIGPGVTWRRMGADRLRGGAIAATVDNVLWLGITNYFSPKGGIVLWLSVDFPVAERTAMPLRMGRRFNVGLAKQFSIHR